MYVRNIKSKNKFCFCIFLFVVWSRRQRRVRVNRIRVNDTGRDSMPNWTHWPVSYLTRLQFSPNWIVSPFWDCPLATCAPRAIFKVNNQQQHDIYSSAYGNNNNSWNIPPSVHVYNLRVKAFCASPADGSTYSFPFILQRKRETGWLKLQILK